MKSRLVLLFPLLIFYFFNTCLAQEPVQTKTQQQEETPSFDKLWYNVKLYRETGSKTKERETIEKIFVLSLSTNNQFQELKSFDQLITIVTLLDRNNYVTMVDQLLQKEDRFKTPELKTLFNLLALKYLVKYNNSSIYKANSTLSKDFTEHSIAQWTNNEISHSIAQRTENIISLSNELLNSSTEPYSEIFSIDNTFNIKFSNYATLAVYTAKFILSENRKHNYCSRSLISTLYKYQDLSKELDNKLLELSEGDIETHILAFLETKTRERNYSSQIDSLISLYNNHPESLLAKCEKLNIMAHTTVNDDKNYYRNIQNKCDSLIVLTNKKEYISFLDAIKEYIEYSSYSLNFNNQFYPKSENNIEITHRNISELNIKLYHLADTIKNYKPNYTQFVTLSMLTDGSKLVLNDNIKLKNYLGIKEKTTYKFKAPKEIGYYLLIIEDPQNSKGNLYKQFSVSNVSSITRQINGNNQILVCNFETGKPYSEAELEIHNSTSREPEVQELKLNNYTSYNIDKDLRNYSIKVNVDKDIFSYISSASNYNSSPTNKEKEPYKLLIYTDRMRYRFGDTIQFKAHAHTTGIDAKLLEGVKHKFSLYAPGGKFVMSSPYLTSDEWGSFTGSFVVPEHFTGGSYYIKADNNPSIYGNNNINVDDFKVLNLELELSHAQDSSYISGEEIIINGKIKSYSAYNISGAKVNIVSTSDDFEHSKTLICDDNGCFTYSFKSKSSELKSKRYFYRTQATITSPTGETINKNITTYINGYRNSIHTSIPSLINKDEGYKPSVQLKSNTLKLDNTKGKYEILTTDSLVVSSGVFTSEKAIDINWNKLKSGSYILKFSYPNAADYKYKTTIYAENDKSSPSNELLFNHSLNKDLTKGSSIEFIMGTNKQLLYVVTELINTNSDIVYTHTEQVKKGVTKFSIPYVADYGDGVKLSLSCVYKGDFFSTNYNYYFKEQAKEKLRMKFISLRDKRKPGEEENFFIELLDSEGEGVESSITLTAYNKASNIPFYFAYRNITPYDTPQFSYLSNRRGDMFSSPSLNSNYPYMQLKESTVFDGNMLLEDNSITPVFNATSIEPIDIRDDFHLTAAFITSLTTNSKGQAEVKFTYPDALATYNIMAVAITKDARSTTHSAEVIINKDVMITAFTPAFIRGCDSTVIRAQAINLTDKDISTELTLNYETETQKGTETYKVTLKPKSNQTFSLKTYATNSDTNLKLSLSLNSAEHKDMEIHNIAVIPSTTRVNNSKSLYITAPLTELDLAELVGSKAKSNEELYIRALDPSIMLTNAIGQLTDKDSNSTISLLNRWNILGVGHKICSKYSITIKNWNSTNPYINNISANTTTWNYKSDSELLERLLFLSQINNVKPLQTANFNKLRNLQNTDGGLSWYKGMNSSPEITMLLFETLYSQTVIGYYIKDQLTNKFYTSAMKYLDNYATKELNRDNSKLLYSTTTINYLYIRTLMDGRIETDDTTQKMIDKYKLSLAVSWRQYPLYEKALIAYILNKQGIDVSDIITSIKEYAAIDGNNGTYFPSLIPPHTYTYHSELHAHAIVLDLLCSLTTRDQALESELAKWLILQRKSQHWDNTSSAFVINSLWRYLQSLQSHTSLCSIYDNNKKRLHNNSSGRSYAFNVNDVREEQQSITIRKANSSPTIIDLEYTYEQPLSEVKAYSNGFVVQRRLYRKKGELLELINSTTPLALGDIVVARYFIHAASSSNFVQLTSMSTAAFTPINNVSGYKNNYYRNVKKNEISYNFYSLPKGDTIIEEHYYTTHSGTFTDGHLSITTLFNPTTHSTTSTQTVKIN